MNGSPIARSIYYTTNNSNKVNGDSTKIEAASSGIRPKILPLSLLTIH
nr:MAG TPA: hypothetical protein [Caudoviricetes sp.]